ncbi:MAG: alanine--glyoxylate aminotransferase family protein [Dehalococcoidia bacterium]|nr:alanine--glyoxylate aminotransferase family protein [Dehalococcoidia bacterium]
MQTERSSAAVPVPIAPPVRLLMGPGPSNVPPSVLEAMAKPVIGHLDPAFLAIMDEVQAMVRQVFRTKNRFALPISGTGSAGMESCFANLLEPGDMAIVGVNGLFGMRMAEVAARYGANVIRVEAPWGMIIPDHVMVEAIRLHRPKVVALVHAETSTGVLQPVEAIARAAAESGALTILDCVTSLGGCPVEIDGWGIDAAYSATQKCLSCPPGLSPVTFSERAIESVRSRKTTVPVWYFDVTLLAQYWGSDRVYHHTAPISMIYALHEALRLALEEGLEVRFQRHRRNHEALIAGLAAMGMELASEEGHRLQMLNAVRVPVGIDEAAVRRRLLSEHGIEIGAGLGPLRGTIWRVGLMGASSSRENVLTFLEAFGSALREQGMAATGDAREAALAEYGRS